jgi:hypothetical protein
MSRASATGRNANGIRSSVGRNANGRNANGRNANGRNAVASAIGRNAVASATGSRSFVGIDANGIDALANGIPDILSEITINTEVFSNGVLPPKPPGTNQLVISMDCDDKEKDECCKINDWMCKDAGVNVSLLNKILNIVKEIANLIIEEYIQFFKPTNMIGPDPRVFAKGAVVSYIIDNFLIRMTGIENEEVKKTINMMTSTYIMLPKNQFTVINYIVKVSQKKINESIYLKTINQQISALLKEGLTNLKL